MLLLLKLSEKESVNIYKLVERVEVFEKVGDVNHVFQFIILVEIGSLHDLSFLESAIFVRS